MSRNIQAVLFDLGNTLMYSPNPWAPIFDQAGRALGAYLHSRKIEVDAATFSGEFRARLQRYYVERERSMLETSSLSILQDMLTEQGFVDLPQTLLRTALNQYYAVTQTNWVLEDDAVDMLKQLRAESFKLGIVSNASDSPDVFALVDKFGIKEYFDFILVSADCGYRKPHPRIFEMALSNWGYLPDEIVMVGDRLEADISGARPLGIYTIWINRRVKTADPLPVIPNTIVATLSEIPPLLLEHFK